MDLPDGVIDSPELFLEVIRVAGCAPGTEQDERDGMKWLARHFAEIAVSVDHAWRDNEQRYRMMFFTGAYVGVKIANEGYKKRLAQLAYNSGMQSPTVD